MLDPKAIERHAIKCGVTRGTLGPGPWMREPDRVEFRHLGFDCLLSRNPSLFFWCGYVAIPINHPFFGKPYDQIPVEIHGGLTYSAKCHDYVCHVVEGHSDHLAWWIGFDCGHYGDVIPSMESKIRLKVASSEEYRDINFVMAETKALARQLAGDIRREISP